METTVRRAQPSDAQAVQRLLAHLGYENALLTVRRRIEMLGSQPYDEILVAEVDSRVVGLIGLHIWRLFHKPGRCGRITALCVSESHRFRGVGRALVESAAAVARRRQCVEMEAISGAWRSGAHRFYSSVGFEELSGKRFKRSLPRRRRMPRTREENTPEPVLTTG